MAYRYATVESDSTLEDVYLSANNSNEGSVQADIFKRYAAGINAEFAANNSISTIREGEATDTFNSGASFNISKDVDAEQMSTRKFDFDSILPPQTPTINSRALRDNFLDFTMEGAGKGDTTDSSFEVARGPDRENALGVSDFDGTTDEYEGGRGGKNASTKAATNDKENTHPGKNLYATGGKFDFTPKVSTTPPKRWPRSRASSGEQEHSKIMDFVSHSGSSGGSKSQGRFIRPGAYSRMSEEQALGNSDTGSVSGRPPRGTRFSGNGGKKLYTDNEMTRDIIVPKSRKALPKSFKSTSDFLKELGLNAGSVEVHEQGSGSRSRSRTPTPQPLPRKSSRKPSALAEPSFVIPQMSDVDDAFDVTRMAILKRDPKTHFKLGPIPVPDAEREVLIAMTTLHDRVSRLETSKASYELKLQKLERELKKASIRFQQEQRKFTERKQTRRASDSESSISGDSDVDKRRETSRLAWQKEKIRLEGNIESLLAHIEELDTELKAAQTQLGSIQNEKNVAVNSVAHAMIANEDLKLSNRELQSQLDKIEGERAIWDRLNELQHLEAQQREERLKRKAREAREAAAIAERVLKESAKRDTEAKQAAEQEARQRRREEKARARQDHEQKELEKAERKEAQRLKQQMKADFDKRVEQELKKIRPDIFEDRTSPLVVPGNGVTPKKRFPNGGKPRTFAVPKSRKKKATVQDASSSDEILIPSDSEVEGVGITPAEIRRLTKEADYELKSRQPARTNQALAAQAEAHKKARLLASRFDDTEPVAATQTNLPANSGKPNRKIVKVMYVMEDGDSEAIELDREMVEALKRVHLSSKASQEAKATAGVPTVTINPDPVTIPNKVNILDVEVDSDDPILPSPTTPVNTHHFHLLDAHAVERNIPHTVNNCTVCKARQKVREKEEAIAAENPLADIDNSMLPAPELRPMSAARRRGSARRRVDDHGNVWELESDQTLRPSLPPKDQLQKVVRQLNDEYTHLKQSYESKHTAFVTLDPCMQKKRRKSITRELTELVADLERKADQIYALYDVNEVFVSGAPVNEAQEQSRLSHDSGVEVGRGRKDEITLLDVGFSSEHDEGSASGSGSREDAEGGKRRGFTEKKDREREFALANYGDETEQIIRSALEMEV